jgi:hypothetical protein
MTEPTLYLNRGPRIESPELRVVSYHEAGHAVVARVFGVGVAHATILARPNESIGHVMFSDDLGLWPLELRLLLYWAGPAAQDKAMTWGRCPLTCSFAIRDEASARTGIAADLGLDPSDRRVDLRIDSARSDAAAAVGAHWAFVERVALALAARKHLTGDEIEALR